MSTTPYLCWLAIITVFDCTPFHPQIAQKFQVVPHQVVMKVKVNMSLMNQVTTVMCQVTLIPQNLKHMQHLPLMLGNSLLHQQVTMKCQSLSPLTYSYGVHQIQKHQHHYHHHHYVHLHQNIHKIPYHHLHIYWIIHQQ